MRVGDQAYRGTVAWGGPGGRGGRGWVVGVLAAAWVWGGAGSAVAQSERAERQQAAEAESGMVESVDAGGALEAGGGGGEGGDWGEGLSGFARWEPAEFDTFVLGEAAFYGFSDRDPRVLSFEVAEPGLLAGALINQADSDVKVHVCDETGQMLQAGYFDDDAYEAAGGEVWSLGLPRAGRYFVVLSTFGGQAGGVVGMGFTPMAGWKDLADPQGRPAEARELSVGVVSRGELEPASGDARDWWVYWPTRDGVLRCRVTAVQSDELDLVLEAYGPRRFWESVAGRDTDLDDEGPADEESLSVVVRRGEPMFFRVRTWLDGEAGGYRLDLRWDE